MDTEITTLNERTTELSDITKDIAESIRREYSKKLKGDPISTTLYAPEFLLKTLSERAEPIKIKLDAMLESVGTVMGNLNMIIQYVFPLLHAINGLIGSTEQSPFIGREVFDAIGDVGKNLVDITRSVEQLKTSLQPVPEAAP
jgi:regulator of replication initiation timing